MYSAALYDHHTFQTSFLPFIFYTPSLNREEGGSITSWLYYLQTLQFCKATSINQFSKLMDKLVVLRLCETKLKISKLFENSKIYKKIQIW